MSGVDRPPVLALAGDGDLARLGLLGDGDLQGEHAGVIAGADVLGVEVVAQDQLPAGCRLENLRTIPPVVTASELP